MDYALGLLILWILFLFPLGLGIHWLVLGATARMEAAPMALLSGLALGVILLSAARRAGIGMGEPALAPLLVVASVLVAVAIWRRRIPWRSRGLLGLGALVLLQLAILQAPVWTQDSDGPLGRGTGREPVQQVATIEAAIGDVGEPSSTVSAAGRSAARRYTGYENLAAFTVAAGQRDRRELQRELERFERRQQRQLEREQEGGSGAELPGVTEGAAGPDPPSGLTVAAISRGWSSYTLHTLIAATLGSLVLLPLWVVARWRDVRALGIVTLLLLGGISPQVMIALGLAAAPAVAAVPFAVGATVGLLLARRDRGWYAVAALNASATLVIVGPLGLVPVACFGVAWILLRGATREHLKQVDAPVSAERPLVAGVLVAMFAVYASAGALLDGVGLEWEPMHQSLTSALLAWPFTWLGGDLGASTPSNLLELAVWLVGPALLGIATAYGLARREVREIAIAAGAVASVAIGAVLALLDPSAGRALVEYTWLVAAPLLFFVCIRAVGLARALGREKETGRFVGAGPLLLMGVLLVFSVASAAVTGSRFLHSPPLPAPSAFAIPAGTTLLAAPEPWIAYVAPRAERARGGIVDPDLLVPERNPYARHGLLYGGHYSSALLDASPFASDPPTGWELDTSFLSSGPRVFRSATALAALPHVDADAPPAESPADLGGAGTGEGVAAPDRHDPVEEEPARDGAPGGLLVPDEQVEDCRLGRFEPCEPRRPIVSGDCSGGALQAGMTRLTGSFVPRPGQAGANGGGSSTAPGGAGRDEEGAARADLVAIGPGAGRGVGGAVDEDEADGPRRKDRVPDEENGSGGTANAAAERLRALAPDKPALLGVACWDVQLGKRTRYLKVHVRDVGLVLTAGDTTPGSRGPGVRAVTGSRDPLEGRDVVSTDRFGSSVTYARDSLADTFDLSFEGQFGSGVEAHVAGPGPSVEAGQVEEEGTRPQPQSAVLPLRAGRGSWSTVYRGVEVYGGIRIINSTGADLQLRRIVARPNRLAPSCELVIEVPGPGDTSRVELQISEGDGAIRPGLVAGMGAVRSVDGMRVARVSLGNYLQRHGVPQHVLADWTEQYSTRPEVAPCSGNGATAVRLQPDAGGAAGARGAGSDPASAFPD